MIIEPTGTIGIRDATTPGYDAEFYITGVPSSIAGAVYVASLPLITAFYWDDNAGEYVVEYNTPTASFILPN